MMNIHYKIVEVWPDSHSIVARYWTDIVTEEMLASDDQRNEHGRPIRCRSDVSITLPIPAPQGEDLDKLIVVNAPTTWLETIENVINPDIDTSLNHISNMLGTEYTKTKAELDNIDNIPSDVSISDQEILEIINKATQEFKTTY